MRCSLLPYQFRVWPRGARVSLINQAFKDSSVGESGRGKQRAGAPGVGVLTWAFRFDQWRPNARKLLALQVIFVSPLCVS